jgi:predicted metal-dependent phosphoesterase TrpH
MQPSKVFSSQQAWLRTEAVPRLIGVPFSGSGETALRKPRAIGSIISATRGGAATGVGEARSCVCDPANHALVECVQMPIRNELSSGPAAAAGIPSPGAKLRRITAVRDTNQAQERWLKAELHAHCSLDPKDYRLCSFSAEEVITEAARLGYEVLAITCHNLDVWTTDLSGYAASLGITLIPGMEIAMEGRWHILVYNFRTGAENLNTFEKVRVRSRPDTLVVAPHPYFPSPKCLWNRLERNIGIFDAIEISGFHTKRLDFNQHARRVATAYSKPLVGNGDVHQLWQLGRTFTWIYSAPGIGPVVNAVKNGQVRVASAALSYSEVARWWATTLWRWAFPCPAASGSHGECFLPGSATKGRESEIAG